jgi:RNA polymerase sigma-70 factor (ECF subfamily)
MVEHADTSTVSHTEPASQAIPRLLEAHGGRMYSLARRMCGRSDEAEDLVQETFLQAFRKWDQFEGRSDPATWLYTIASRLCYRMHRRRSGEPDRIASLQDLLPFKDGPVPDVAGDDDGPLSEQLRRESKRQIEHAITMLPPSFRLPLILKDIIGFSVADVAEILGLKEATVKTRLHRARHVLRRELSESLPQREAPPPAYPKRVCLDLLRAKQEALDRGAPFPLPDEDFCERCAAIFASMDLSKEVCERLSEDRLPERVRDVVMDDIAQEQAAG